MATASKKRYQAVQTMMKHAGSTGCLFLCLLSIAEEEIETTIDFIDAYNKCFKAKLINEDFYCKDQEKILKILTGKKFKREVRDSLPKVVPNNMYTVEKWHNDTTGFDHFKRRGFDTLVNCSTVTGGKLISYYCYILEE